MKTWLSVFCLSDEKTRRGFHSKPLPQEDEIIGREYKSNRQPKTWA